jgi:hypothetical protein
MTRFLKVGLSLALGLGLALAAVAADETKTLNGVVTCGKCTLKKAADCQNVLVADGQEYYVAKSEAADKVGHVCKGEKKVKATGTVSEKDGKKWLTASAMEELKAN